MSPALPPAGGPLRPDPGTMPVCVFSCVLALLPYPSPGECALLASPATRLSCSSLIYYKGDGDKQPREPPRIQCPHRSSRSRPWYGLVTGSRRWNFCRVCLICVVSRVFFCSCHIYWRGCSVQTRPWSCHGECEPAVLVGARYRLLLRARHQAENLWPGPGPLRACGQCPKHHSLVWCRLSLGFSPRASATSPLDGSKMVVSACPKILLQLIHKDEPGGPGASICEQVLEVPAQEESQAGRAAAGRWQGSGRPGHSRGCQPLLVWEVWPPGHEPWVGIPGRREILMCIRGCSGQERQQ